MFSPLNYSFSKLIPNFVQHFTLKLATDHPNRILLLYSGKSAAKIQRNWIWDQWCDSHQISNELLRLLVVELLESWALRLASCPDTPRLEYEVSLELNLCDLLAEVAFSSDYWCYLSLRHLTWRDLPLPLTLKKGFFKLIKFNQNCERKGEWTHPENQLEIQSIKISAHASSPNPAQLFFCLLFV